MISDEGGRVGQCDEYKLPALLRGAGSSKALFNEHQAENMMVGSMAL